MQTGVIRRRDGSDIVGRWRANAGTIVVETEDQALRRASDEILNTPQRIPVHSAERQEFATHGDTRIETPSTIKYLALFALELEQRGFVLEPDDD